MVIIHLLSKDTSTTAMTHTRTAPRGDVASLKNRSFRSLALAIWGLNLASTLAECIWPVVGILGCLCMLLRWSGVTMTSRGSHWFDNCIGLHVHLVSKYRKLQP